MEIMHNWTVSKALFQVNYFCYNVPWNTLYNGKVGSAFLCL
jgi:hypothetical protein